MHSRLSILWEKFPPAEPYFGLHVFWFCEKIPFWTFITSCMCIGIGPASLLNLRKKSPCTALCWSAHLMFFKNFPACTFISSYLSIWYTIVAVAYGERHMTSFCDVIVTETQGRVFRGQLQFPQLLLK